MPQLSDEQALDYIRKARSAGVPEQRIKDVLAQEYAAPEYESQVAGQTGAAYHPFTQQDVTQSAATTKEGLKQMGKAGIVAGLSYLGGLPAAAAAPEGWGVLAGLGGQTAGAFGGTLLGQKAIGEPLNFSEAGSNAIWTAGAGLGTQAISKIAGVAGGVEPAAVESVGMRSRVLPRFDLTMVEPKQNAELTLGRQIGGEVALQAKPITPGRIAEKGFINAATTQGEAVDPQPTIDALRSRMLKTPKTAAGRNYNRQLNQLAIALEQTTHPEQIIEQVKQSHILDEYGKPFTSVERTVIPEKNLLPNEMDELIGGELDPSLYRGGKPSGRMTSKALIPARQTATQSLMETLPPEAKLARAQAAQELTRREVAEKYFGLSRNEKALIGQIRDLYKPGNEGALESLRGVGQQAGVDFEAMAKDLATRRSFTQDDRLKASILHRIMMSIGVVGLTTGRPGYAAAAFLSQPSTARMVSKITSPLQMLAGPAGALMAQRYKSQYPAKRETPQVVSPHSQDAEHNQTAWQESRIAPEQMFPDMTNTQEQQ